LTVLITAESWILNYHGSKEGKRYPVYQSTIINLQFTIMNCPCPKKKCPRRGDCIPCREYHAIKNKLPRCERPKIRLWPWGKKELKIKD
jgi:hypothetical protein